MRFISLLVFIGLVGVAAVTGARYMPGPWYQSLAKPGWTPPDWLFPIAWTILYFMIAIAGWKVWQAEGLAPALVVWLAGLVLNAAWSYLMFGRHEIGLALIDVSAMWVTLVAFIWLAWNVDRDASYLFLPYLVWVTFATALNAAVWQMNPNYAQ